MKYLYYPGCSLKGTGRGYEESLLAIFDTLDVHLEELQDWNCCGATAYMAVDETKAFALAARNLALAEQQNDAEAEVHLITPCAACYLVLIKCQRNMAEYDDLATTITKALNAAGLEYRGRVRVRHPLDVLVNDVGLATVGKHIKRPLYGLRTACYYGCQIVRPWSDFDNQDNPTTMDQLAQMMGAEPVDWPLKTRCCGGSLTGTIERVGLRLNHILLKEAQECDAELILTACPLCQFNLECFQNQINRRFDTDIDLPVLYFTQLLGLAMGIDKKRLGLHRVFVPFTMPSASTRGGGLVEA